MAKREENLKKINDELEKMSDEELDQVAGGYIGETASDSKFLYEYGLVDDWHGDLYVAFHWEKTSSEVDSGWSKSGITCVTKPFGGNDYWLNGKKITRDEAYDIVKKNFSKVRSIVRSI